MSDIFLSYSSEDRKRIIPLAQALVRRGYSVFWDRNILAGKTWRGVLESELEAARCVLVAWSHSANKSQWVQEEAEAGKKRGILVPVTIDEVQPPFGFRGVQAASLSDWPASSLEGTEEFEELMKSLSAILGPGKPVPNRVHGHESSKPRGNSRLVLVFVGALGIGGFFVVWTHNRMNGIPQTAGRQDGPAQDGPATPDREHEGPPSVEAPSNPDSSVGSASLPSPPRIDGAWKGRCKLAPSTPGHSEEVQVFVECETADEDRGLVSVRISITRGVTGLAFKANLSWRGVPPDAFAFESGAIHVDLVGGAAAESQGTVVKIRLEWKASEGHLDCMIGVDLLDKERLSPHEIKGILVPAS